MGTSYGSSEGYIDGKLVASLYGVSMGLKYGTGLLSSDGSADQLEIRLDEGTQMGSPVGLFK